MGPIAANIREGTRVVDRGHKVEEEGNSGRGRAPCSTTMYAGVLHHAEARGGCMHAFTHSIGDTHPL